MKTVVDLLHHSWEVYVKNLKMLLFFSMLFVFALLVPLFSPAPTYSALGGYFLRSGSIAVYDLSLSDIIVIIVSSLISLYLLSLALVAVNLVVKSMRTRTRVSSDALRNLGRYTAVVFFVYLAVKIIEFGILSYTIANNISEFPVYVFTFLASLGLFYVAPAVVLEEKKPVSAISSSYNHILRKPGLFVLWIAVAFILLLIIKGVFYMLLEAFSLSTLLVQVLIVLISSLFVLPYLIILQAQMYLTKYTILK